MASRQLDIEIAKHIFGYIVFLDTANDIPLLRDVSKNTYMEMPKWSEDTTSAHQLITHFQKHGLSCRISDEITPDGIEWTVGFCEPNAETYNTTTSNTLPKAICLAALDMVNKKKRT
jgi:hypothetical protein